MARKRITQVFPFILPVRQWQRKKFFYNKMYWDNNSYAKSIETELYPFPLFETKSIMVNKNSGYDIVFQYNKVHNLKLAANKINKIIIAPGEVFSFWQLVKDADKLVPYKNGLNLVDERIVESYGGGLCQLSNELFWMFLNSPLTVVERHGHVGQSIPPTTEDQLSGIDATISEGWLDLKVKNDTSINFQVTITFNNEEMNCRLLSNQEFKKEYQIYNSDLLYYKSNNDVFQTVSVCRNEIDLVTNQKNTKVLYTNLCQIKYKLPNNINIKERGKI